MPSPFMCHGCDTPTMNRSGVCDNCEDAYDEGSNEKLSTVIELEQRIDWLENGLKTIFNCGDQGNPSFMRAVAQATLDGEPTTADYFNRGDDIEYNYIKKKLNEEYGIKDEFNELDKEVDELKEQIIKLEAKAHAPRDFVICEMCKEKIKEK